MGARDDGGPAFPSGEGQFAGFPGHQYGMTLRDWMAASATEKDLKSAMSFGSSFTDQDDRARARYAFADAMLAARLEKDS